MNIFVCICSTSLSIDTKDFCCCRTYSVHALSAQATTISYSNDSNRCQRILWEVYIKHWMLHMKISCQLRALRPVFSQHWLICSSHCIGCPWSQCAQSVSQAASCSTCLTYLHSFSLCVCLCCDRSVQFLNCFCCYFGIICFEFDAFYVYAAQWNDVGKCI